MLNRIVLIILSLLIMMIGDVNVQGIAAMLCVIIVAAACMMRNNTVSKAICSGYVIAAMIFEPFLYFIPLVIYEMFSKRSVWGYIWIVPFVLHFYKLNVDMNLLLIFISCAIALCLKVEQQKIDSLENKFRLVRDSGIENEMVLKKRNQILISRQDNEISLAMLDERNRISREIHDNVGHLLTRSLYQVSAMQIVHKNNEQVCDELTQLKSTLTSAMDNIRASVHNLHDESVDLKMRIQKVIDDFDFCKVNFKYNCGDMPKELKYCFISIVCEALSNISKHSNATAANVSIIEHPGFYQLIIEDNGTVKKKKGGSGIGIIGMRERIESFNGIFRVIEDKGFKVFSTVPKENVE